MVCGKWSKCKQKTKCKQFEHWIKYIIWQRFNSKNSLKSQIKTVDHYYRWKVRRQQQDCLVDAVFFISFFSKRVLIWRIFQWTHNLMIHNFIRGDSKCAPVRIHFENEPNRISKSNGTNDEIHAMRYREKKDPWQSWPCASYIQWSAHFYLRTTISNGNFNTQFMLTRNTIASNRGLD